MKIYNPLILFLDEDFTVSAQSLTNKYLEKNIKHISQILMCCIFYYIGIRSPRHYQYYILSDKYPEIKSKYLIDYPDKRRPDFTFYSSKESKWCRMCVDHYNYLVDYFDALLFEYSYRFNKDHELYPRLLFYRTIPINLALSAGINIPLLGLKKIQLPYKNLHPIYRTKNLIEGYRQYYIKKIENPLVEYYTSKRDVPDWVMKKFTPDETIIV